MIYDRHVLICGATGSGKTNTLRGILANSPVPALVLDCKGDLGGSAQFALPLCSLGPGRLARLIARSPVQGDTLSAVFAAAESSGRALVTLDDLRGAIDWASGARIATRATCNALHRGSTGLVPMRHMFTADRMQFSGRVDASATIGRPEVYAVLVDWLLAELMAGPESPLRGIVAIDEAHLLSDCLEAPLRLLRSRGWGAILATQSPEDLSEGALANCGSIICHAIRVRSPRALRRAEILAGECGVTARALGALAPGEAAVSILVEGRVEKGRKRYPLDRST